VIRGQETCSWMKTVCGTTVVLLLAFAGSVIAAPLLFSGSSTAQKRILEPVQKTLEKRTGVAIDIMGAGTIRGIKDLMAGSAGAALSDCPLALAFQETGVPTEGTYQEHVIAQDQIVAIVNRRNKVKKLTGEQLAGIHSGKITNWKEVGGPDERIVVVIPPQSSGTRSVIQDSLLGGGSFVANAYVTVTDREALEIVGKSPIAIAMLSEGFVDRKGKDVKTVSTPQLKRQLCIITKNEPSDDLKKVIKFLQSKEAKRLFK
jgi:phosphate transport system substrate-binding protein